MKNLIMFFVLVMIMVFSSYEISYSQEEDGFFLFLIGNEGNEKAIMYLHIETNLYEEGWSAYGSYYTKNQSISTIFSQEEGGSGFYVSFDGENLKLSYTDNNGKKGKITGTLSLEGGEIESSAGGITFRGKNNSKNVNLSLANAPVNFARIRGTDWENGKRFIFNVRTLDNLSYVGRYANIVYLDENIIVFGEYLEDGNNSSSVYSINTGKKIEIKDFISNLNDRNLLALLRKKVLEYASNNDDDYNYYNYNDKIDYFDLYGFYITPKGIAFYVYDEDMGGNEPHFIDIDFTFEELKPFIKRGSPLDYLFN